MQYNPGQESAWEELTTEHTVRMFQFTVKDCETLGEAISD
jgi:hypothetical protein